MKEFDTNVIQECIIQIEEMIGYQPNMRHWQEKGSFPRKVLPILLQLLDHYFDVGEENNFSSDVNSYPKFLYLMYQFVSVLKTYPISDIRHLYGATLFLDPKENPTCIFFANFFLRCLRGDLVNIKSEMQGFALALVRYDATQLSKSKFLDSIYKSIWLGSSFSLGLFSKMIAYLLVGASPNLTKKLNDLSLRVQSELVWSDEIIQQIRAIFEFRWSEVKDTVLDYTRYPTHPRLCDPNVWWCRTAQLLSAAGLVGPNWYRILMPTVLNDEVRYFGSLMDYPLSHLILSGDQKRLISLDVSAGCCDVTKIFCDHSIDPPRPFTQLEQKRISYSAPGFYVYVKQYIDYDEVPLSKKDLEILIKLVNNTLDPNGLEEWVDPKRLDFAEYEYLSFGDELATRIPADANRLLRHRTRQRTRNMDSNLSILETLNNIKQGGPEGCIASCGKYFAKTVLDYMPWHKFNTEIETSSTVGTALMRAFSAKKVLQDYDFLTKEEAIRRNNILMVSLLTYEFDNSWFYTGKIQFLDLSNKVEEKQYRLIHEIFKQLQPSIEATDPSNNPRYTYVSIIEGIVRPALMASNNELPQTVVDWFNLMFEFGSVDSCSSTFTRPGLSAPSINPEDKPRDVGSRMNSQQTRIDLKDSVAYFEHGILLKALELLSRESFFSIKLQKFLEELILYCKQPNSDAVKSVRASVKLIQLLDQLELSERDVLLSCISDKTKLVELKRQTDLRLSKNSYSFYNCVSRPLVNLFSFRSGSSCHIKQ